MAKAGGEALFDAQWADDWHHCLHVLLTGEQEGYYESFRRSRGRSWRVAMAEGFVFQGEVSPHHGDAARRAIGRAAADRLCHLPAKPRSDRQSRVGRAAERAGTTPHALAAATALLLLFTVQFRCCSWVTDGRGVTTPFLFFTDHDEDLAGLVREGRRKEFAHFAAFQDEARRALIPDPNAVSTFTGSVPDPGEAESGAHADALALHKRLLAARREHVVPGIPGCRSLGARALGRSAVQASWRLGNGRVLSIAANFSEQPVAVDALTGTVIFSTVNYAPGSSIPPRCTVATISEPA